MIEQLKNYLSNESCDLENDTVSSILLDEDRIQIYFSVDEDYDVTVDNIELFDKEGNVIPCPIHLELIVRIELNEWVKPIDNTVVIEGISYEI